MYNEVTIIIGTQHTVNLRTHNTHTVVRLTSKRFGYTSDARNTTHTTLSVILNNYDANWRAKCKTIKN